jgi:protein-S-isoprenylcysteine O-methyltransferase Ste14
MNWKWFNIPVPEAHLVGLIAGVIIQIFFPIGITLWVWLKYLLGLLIMVVGILFALWAVRAAGKMDIASPSKVLYEGPYAYSRNPMYVGWTLMILGIALVMDNMWMLLILLIVVIYTHFFVILQEEKFMTKIFGKEYEQYKMKVRRYL